MNLEFWQKQVDGKPLFEDILWSRPENRHAAGKLLVVGGNAQGFAAVGEAYAAADQAGAGVIRALMPDALKKMVGPVIGPYEFAPSTPSGSFARQALAELLAESAWADMTLLAGDLGRNSETSALLEQFVQKYREPLVVSKDAVDYFYLTPEILAERPDTVLVLSLGQLQKFGVALRFTTPFLLSMGMLLLVQALHDLTIKFPVTIVTKELDQIVVAIEGRVTSTKLIQDREIWRVATAGRAATYWMQSPTQPLEAITTSLLSDTD